MRGFKCWLCPAEQPDDDVLCEDCRRELEDSLSQLTVSSNEAKRAYTITKEQLVAAVLTAPATSPAKGPPKHE